jgi:hypothetical protein
MPRLERQMYSAVDDVARFNDLAGRLERAEAGRRNTGLMKARKAIAPRLGVTPCTLENYRASRLKGVPHWLMQRVRDELVAVLQSEMDRLGHEIQIYKQTIGGHRDDALSEAEASLAKAREFLVGDLAHKHKADPPSK